MKRWLTIAAITAVWSVQIRADVKVTSTATLEGPMAAMMGGVVPSIVTQIKGNKGRTDISMGEHRMSTITDVDAKQIIVLNDMEKTARVFTAESMPSAPEGFVMPKIESTLKPTGQTKLIGGAQCEEQVLTLSLSMAEMAGSQKMPPQTAEIMKDVRMSMNGSIWVAKSGPGVAEYVAFHAASGKQNMEAFSRALPGLASSGLGRLMESFTGALGLPYLVEMKMAIEGGGEMAGLLKQFGDMKFTSRVTDVSTASLANDVFTIPTDYKLIK